MHLHISRGKRIDRPRPAHRGGRGRSSSSWCASADAVVEAMRPGGLERRGLGYEACREVNPRIVFCTISGYGMTGPYKDMPSHGIAYDTWAGLVQPEIDDDGFCDIPEHPSIGIHAGPLFGALGILAGIIQARATGERLPARDRPVRRRRRHGLAAQRDVEGLRATRGRGHRQQGRRLRAPGARHRRHAGRRPLPVLRDAPTATCCSWRPSGSSGRTSARASAAPTSSRRTPARSTPTTPRGNTELRARAAPRSSAAARPAEWVEFGGRANTPIAPVNTPRDHRRRPAVPGPACRGSPRSASAPSSCRRPIKLIGEELPLPTMAPTAGQHTDAVLDDVLGYDAGADRRAARRRRPGLTHQRCRPRTACARRGPWRSPSRPYRSWARSPMAGSPPSVQRA